MESFNFNPFAPSCSNVFVTNAVQLQPSIAAQECAEYSAVTLFQKSLVLFDELNLVAKVCKKIETPVFQDHYAQC